MIWGDQCIILREQGSFDENIDHLICYRSYGDGTDHLIWYRPYGDGTDHTMMVQPI